MLKHLVALALAMAGVALAWAPARAAPTCKRPAAGAVIAEPPALFSANGVLNIDFNYVIATDAYGRTLYCFVTPDGQESPTLHVSPGDTLEINLHNIAPPGAIVDIMPAGRHHGPMDMGGPNAMSMSGPVNCTPSAQNRGSVNMHFHGLNISPACHQDEVITTVINFGDSYQYRLKIPADEPPGLYWYHPHIHGIAEGAVQGGATGAIVVDGIESVQPAVGGLPERVLIFRDQNVVGNPPPGGKVPSWDVTLNYVPNAYPNPNPGVIKTAPGQKEFWRFVNASANTVADIALTYDGVDQPIGVVALDGVPTGSHEGAEASSIVSATHVLVPTAGRVEFVMTTPSATVSNAIFQTRRIDTGPAGDTDTTRTLAVFDTSNSTADAALPRVPMPFTASAAGGERFAGLQTAPITAQRKLYFSELPIDPSNPFSSLNFYITVAGQKPTPFSPFNPPAIVTTQGAVEEWTIENRAPEVHEFHIHQIHFLLEKINGVAAPPAQRQFRDTVQVPYWTGSGPYPSVTLLMDFRGPVTGDFVYHCHILDHEDAGMMAIIRVLPKTSAGS